MTIPGYENTGKPTATDKSWFESRAKLSYQERMLLIILDWHGEQDQKVVEYQERCRYHEN